MDGDSDRSEALLAQMAPTLAQAPAGCLGVAVSGGSDSLALLLLTERWARRASCEIKVVTVDHGLRHGAAAEAEAVADLCRMRGLSHRRLHWQREAAAGNLQALARTARQRLIGDWAAREGAGAVALGHTLDDQAETFVMRLARGSGVDGLACMRAVSRLGGTTWLRPMLDLRRDDLREWLSAQGMCWAEDPSNTDLRFDRVRARAAFGELEGLGLTRERLAVTASRMQCAREALERDTAELAASCAALGPCGEVSLSCAEFTGAPAEIRARLLAAILCWIGCQDYRPRFEPLAQLVDAITTGRVGGGKTLHGCVLRQRKGGVLIRREVSRPAGPVPIQSRVWDRRWRLCAAKDLRPGLVIGALGRDGLAQVATWRATGAARESLLTTPAIWSGSRVVAAPLAGLDNGFGFRLQGFPAELTGMSQLD
jgi:tRNA(Ile)-lysidine synthase